MEHPYDPSPPVPIAGVAFSDWRLPLRSAHVERIRRTCLCASSRPLNRAAECRVPEHVALPPFGLLEPRRPRRRRRSVCVHNPLCEKLPQARSPWSDGPLLSRVVDGIMETCASYRARSVSRKTMGSGRTDEAAPSSLGGCGVASSSFRRDAASCFSARLARRGAASSSSRGADAPALLLVGVVSRAVLLAGLPFGVTVWDPCPSN